MWYPQTGHAIGKLRRLTRRYIATEMAVAGHPRLAVDGGALDVRTSASLNSTALRDPVVLTVAGLTVLAALARFLYVGHQGFWYDEGNTALLVHMPIGQMLSQIPKRESTPPLYYLLAWGWARIFGFGEAGLRSLSACIGVVTVPVLYGAGARLISRRTGVVAAALCACSPLLIWYSQEARSYALLVLISAISLLAFERLLASPRRGPAAAWAVVSVLALATHYYAVLVVAPEAVWLLAVHRRRRPVQGAMALVICGSLALAPLALSQMGTGRSSWIARAALTRRLGQLVPEFVVGFPTPSVNALEPVAVLIVILAAGLALAPGGGPGRRGALRAGVLAVSGLILNLAVIAFGTDDLLTRNVLALWPPAALLVAAGLASPRVRRVGPLATVLLCAAGLSGTIAVAVDRNLQRPDWRGVTRLLGTGGRPGSAPRLILIQRYRALLPLTLYMPRLNTLKRPIRASEFDVVSFTAPPSEGFCWWGPACNLAGSPPQRYVIPGLREVWRRNVYQFTVVHMVATGQPVVLTRRKIFHALRTTTARRDEILIQR